MEPTATMSASPALRAEPESAEVRARQLAAARRRATALLGAVTVLFVAVTAAGVHGILLGYVQAGAAAFLIAAGALRGLAQPSDPIALLKGWFLLCWSVAWRTVDSATAADANGRAPCQCTVPRPRLAMWKLGAGRGGHHFSLDARRRCHWRQ